MTAHDPIIEEGLEFLRYKGAVRNIFRTIVKLGTPSRLNEIVKASGNPMGTVGVACIRLEELGLIVRNRSDGLNLRCAPSDLGRELDSIIASLPEEHFVRPLKPPPSLPPVLVCPICKTRLEGKQKRCEDSACKKKMEEYLTPSLPMERDYQLPPMLGGFGGDDAESRTPPNQLMTFKGPRRPHQT